MNGRPFKVVQFAQDVTKHKLRSADAAAQIAAIDKAQGIIEFDPAGKILSVNANFEKAFGYTADEIVGRHRSMLMDAAAAQSPEYAQFWDELRRGEHQARVFQRRVKSGEPIWIQAAASSMEQVVDLIRRIAGQVNLLALNATIEAARAGEAGRGFSVVAFEVKELARQTSQATDGIAAEIANVQAVSQSVARSIELIMAAARNVHSYVSGVAAAMEQQSALTQEMSQHSQQAFGAVRDIGERIKRLARA